MKNMQKGFTLVELIVVITILAILGTIAFISLQGYSQDARDSKVTSDVRSLASAIETAQTQEGNSLSDFVVSGTRANNAITNITPGTNQIVGTETLTGTVQYSVGNIDFVALQQNGTDFRDGDGNDLYAIATISANTDAGEAYQMYQIAGQKGATDLRQAVIKGNFIAGTDSTDGVRGLVSASGSTTALIDGESFSGDLN